MFYTLGVAVLRDEHIMPYVTWNGSEGTTESKWQCVLEGTLS